jgi:hypothetical protein
MSTPHDPQGNPMSHEERVDRVLRRVHRRHFRGHEACTHTGHPIDWNNPLDEIIAREEQAMVEASMEAIETTQAMLGLDVLPEVLAARVREVVFDHFQQLERAFFAFFFADGPEPLKSTQRLFAAAKHHDAELLWNMSFRDLGELFGETGSNVHARQTSLFGELPAGWRKGQTARANMKASAKGNKNRRGGKKARN